MNIDRLDIPEAIQNYMYDWGYPENKPMLKSIVEQWLFKTFRVYIHIYKNGYDNQMIMYRIFQFTEVEKYIFNDTVNIFLITNDVSDKLLNNRVSMINELLGRAKEIDPFENITEIHDIRLPIHYQTIDHAYEKSLILFLDYMIPKIQILSKIVNKLNGDL